MRKLDDGRIKRLDLTDVRTGKVYKDCQVLDGIEGVFAACRIARPGYSDLIQELHGDDGFWYAGDAYDSGWLEGHIACLRRVQ